MPELERELRALARAIDYPATPDLAARLAGRLGSTRPGPARLPLARALAVAAVWLVVTAALVAAASRDVADALRNVENLTGVTIEWIPEPAPEPTPRDLDLGPRATLREAARDVAFRPLLPRILGGPDEVHVRAAPRGGELSLLYDPRSDLPPAITTGLGLLVTEFRGDLAPEYLTKVAPQATAVSRLRVGGDRAIWIAGAPHYFFYRSPGGGIAQRDLQVAQNVLLIERGRVLVRMEGAFDRATAVRLAGTLSPFTL
jgi:hypothetical protein